LTANGATAFGKPLVEIRI